MSCVHSSERFCFFWINARREHSQEAVKIIDYLATIYSILLPFACHGGQNSLTTIHTTTKCNLSSYMIYWGYDGNRGWYGLWFHGLVVWLIEIGTGTVDLERLGSDHVSFVDVCGRCCVIEEFPLCGGGSTYRINEI